MNWRSWFGKGTAKDWALIALVILGVILFAWIQSRLPPVQPEEAHAYDMTP